MKSYEYLDHPADVGIAARGSTQAEVFEAAAEGLAAFLCEPEDVNEREELNIAASAPDRESLLVEWLNEINYLFEVREFAFRTFHIREIDDNNVRGIGRGEPFDPSRHRFGEQVKAATYHELEVRQEENGWRATVLLDI